MTEAEALDKAITKLGSQSELARRLSIKPQSVQHWVATGRVPGNRVLDIERLVEGAVTRHQLRPDFYPA